MSEKERPSTGLVGSATGLSATVPKRRRGVIAAMDNNGFGFLIPTDGGGEMIFVHDAGGGLCTGDEVEYAVGVGGDGRPRAIIGKAA